ncbi:MAG: hypothetical protein ACHQ0Y_12605 [Thermodesulfovibrionales bacterium]
MRILETTIIYTALLAIALAGCATNTAVTERIREKSIEQEAVFQELTDGMPTSGFSVLTIQATMKTPKKGFYPLEFRSALHGKPEYPFVFNIGGQGVTWLAKGMPDIQQKTIEEKRNPEGGEGVKYILEKRIMLKPGTYKIYVGITEEALQKEVDVTLSEGKVSVLQFIPIYFAGRFNRNAGSFYWGLRDFEVYLDGVRINPK